MKHIKFSTKFRVQLSDKLMDLGNYSAIGLVFAQLLPGVKFSQSAFLLGVILTLVCYVIGYLIYPKN
ncbi:MAG: hypothetical protein AAB874_00990 [Patescibacteria group bacterium]